MRVVQLDAELINIVDHEGKRRMALFDAAHQPDLFMEGEEFANSRQGSVPVAGVTFYNGEGDECGGLAFGSRQLDDGS